MVARKQALAYKLNYIRISTMLNDRSYIRRNPFGQKTYSAVIWVIIINIGFFLLQTIAEAWFKTDIFSHFLALSSSNITNGFIWTLLTYSVLHAGITHILFNMLVIFFIGRIIEEQLGTKRFLQIYIISAIIGGLTWLLFNYNQQDVLVGASGAGFGLLAYFCLRNPEERMTILLFFVIPVNLKPKWLLWGLLSIEVFSFLFYELPGNSVMASSAHLGGILSAYILYFLFTQKSFFPNRKISKARDLYKTQSGISIKQGDVQNFKINVRSRDELRKEVDRILDKINALGFGALTLEEKRLLDDAKEWLHDKR